MGKGNRVILVVVALIMAYPVGAQLLRIHLVTQQVLLVLSRGSTEGQGPHHQLKTQLEKAIAKQTPRAPCRRWPSGNYRSRWCQSIKAKKRMAVLTVESASCFYNKGKDCGRVIIDSGTACWVGTCWGSYPRG